jgi:hypothetical protein
MHNKYLSSWYFLIGPLLASGRLEIHKGDTTSESYEINGGWKPYPHKRPVQEQRS